MDNITVALSVQAWNAVLAALGAKPFAEVAELIAEIKRQAEEQIVVAPPTDASASPQKATVQ